MVDETGRVCYYVKVKWLEELGLERPRTVGRELDMKYENPLVEFFGFPLDNTSDTALNYRKAKICPFTLDSCIKLSQKHEGVRMGTCTAYYAKKDVPVIICPNRLKEGGHRVLQEASSYCFPGKPELAVFDELQLRTKNSQHMGNLDFLVAEVKEQEGEIEVGDFIGVELQAVNITGTLSDAYADAMQNCGLEPEWGFTGKYKHSFNLLDTAKGLYTQLLREGRLFTYWTKYLVVALQDVFFEDMSARFGLELKDRKGAPGAYTVMQIYTLKRKEDEQRYTLELSRQLTIRNEDLLEAYQSVVEALPDLQEFTQRVARRASSKKLFRAARGV